MRLTLLRRLLLLFALTTLAACHSRNPNGGAETPEGAVRQSLVLIRAGNFDGYLRHALPPRDYATLRADWEHNRTRQPQLTEVDRARIDMALQELRAPHAAATLDAQLQPWLAQAQLRYGDQLPMLVSVGRVLASGAVVRNNALSEAQKQHLNALLLALVPWAQRAPWFDPGKAHQAVAIAVATVQTLDLRDAQSLRAQDFEHAMRSYAALFHALEQMLALYGLPVDQALASAHAVPLDYHPPSARVRIEYTLFGKPLGLESTLVQQDGHWYDQDLINSVRQAHRQLTAPTAPTAPTAAGMLPPAR